MPVTENNIYRLKFVIKKGVASGWTAALTQECLDWHKREYGPIGRPEIFDDDFIDKEVVGTIMKPNFVYPSVELNKYREVVYRNALMFFKQKMDMNFPLLINGKRKKDFVKVVIKRDFNNKELKIITFYPTPWIGVDRYVAPLLSIEEKKIKAINNYKLYK